MIFTVTPVESDVKIKEDSGSSWKQLFLSFIATLPFFTQGLQTADLSQNFQFTVVPPTEVPWTVTSQILASVVFTPIFCCTIDKYGRKFGLYLAIMSQGVSCIPLFLPPNDISSIFVHITTGITYVGIFITIPIYIREMNNDTRRGTMIAVTMVMLSLGKICATMMEFENLIYLIVAMVTLEFLALLLTVETPSYFVMINQIEKASETFGRLKSIKKGDAIVSKEINNLNDESRRAKDKGKLNLYRILKHVIWRDCTNIGLVLYTVTTLCGCSIFLDHRKTLLQLKLDKTPDDVLVCVLLMAGSVLTFILISFLERKYLLTLSYFTTAFFMGILAVFTQADLTVTELRWLPQVCLAVIIFAYGMLWGLPLILMTEMYNLQIRSRLLGLLFIYSQALNLIHLHTLKYIEELMGIYTMFYVFSSVNLFGAVYSLFKIPAVKNKSVKKIEKLLKRIPLIKL